MQRAWQSILLAFFLASSSPITLADPAQPAQPVAASVASEPAKSSEGSTKTSLGIRVDCLHDFNRGKGATQECASITGLSLRVDHELNPAVDAYIQIDPFTTPRASRSTLPMRQDLPKSTDTGLGIIDQYGVQWRPRPNLTLTLGSFDGTVDVPSVSTLAFGSFLQDSGWKQTALRLGYDLSMPTAMHVEFVAGNGEGETVRNLDAQQYFGFRADMRLTQGLRLLLGGSLDGNSAGSEETVFRSERLKTRCIVGDPPAVPKGELGHSTQRLMAGLVLDGTFPGVEGLSAALGWQRSTATDLDKKQSGEVDTAVLAAANCRLDPELDFFEDPAGATANSVRRTVYNASFNYRILERFFIAGDYSIRNLNTGAAKPFSPCLAFTDASGAPVCEAKSSDDSNRLKQDAWTVGAGMTLAPGLRLALEYFRSAYERTYSQVYYVGEAGKPSSSLELFAARLAYNWL